jgi:hypothetical protein
MGTMKASCSAPAVAVALSNEPSTGHHALADDLLGFGRHSEWTADRRLTHRLVLFTVLRSPPVNRS